MRRIAGQPGSLVMVALALGAAAPATRVAGAQVNPTGLPAATGGAVAGTVWDSTAGQPLRGAVVQLVAAANPAGPAMTVAADSLGRWRAEGLPLGTYLVGFTHPSLDALGIEAPRVLAPIGPGALGAPVSLFVPGPRTIVLALCAAVGAAAPGDSVGTVAGTVRDAATGDALSGATVAVTWLEYVIERGSMARVRRTTETQTNAAGAFVLCGVPAGVTVGLTADSRGHTTGVAEALVSAGTLLRRDLAVGGTSEATAPAVSVPGEGPAVARADASATAPALTRTDEAARVVGIVRDGRGRPRADVRVRDVSGGPGADARVASTGPDGRFVLAGLPGGSRVIEAAAVGYTPVHAGVDAVPGRPVEVAITLGERVPVLDPVRVRADAPTAGAPEEFERRRRSLNKFGTFLTAAQIEAMHTAYFTDLARSARGFRVEHTRDGVIATGRAGCLPVVFIDGLPRGDSSSSLLEGLLRANSIAGVELYPGANGLPVQYTGGSGGFRRSGCGAILVWTKRR